MSRKERRNGPRKARRGKISRDDTAEDEQDHHPPMVSVPAKRPEDHNFNGHKNDQSDVQLALQIPGDSEFEAQQKCGGIGERGQSQQRQKQESLRSIRSHKVRRPPESTSGPWLAETPLSALQQYGRCR